MFKFFNKKKENHINRLQDCLIEQDYIITIIEHGVTTGETIATNDIPAEYRHIIIRINDLMAKAYAPKVEVKKCDCKCQENKKPAPKKATPKKSVKKPS